MRVATSTTGRRLQPDDRNRRKGRVSMKAFIASLAAGALVLVADASAASSAKPSLQHYMIGFGHAPTAADTALVKGHGGIVRYSFGSIGVLAVDLPASEVNRVKQSAGVS